MNALEKELRQTHRWLHEIIWEQVSGEFDSTLERLGLSEDDRETLCDYAMDSFNNPGYQPTDAQALLLMHDKLGI